METKYTYVSNHPLFKSLTAEEEKEFRQWARDNLCYAHKPNPVWHPVVRDEYDKILAEAAAKALN